MKYCLEVENLEKKSYVASSYTYFFISLLISWLLYTRNKNCSRKRDFFYDSMEYRNFFCHDSGHKPKKHAMFLLITPRSIMENSNSSTIITTTKVHDVK